MSTRKEQIEELRKKIEEAKLFRSQIQPATESTTHEGEEKTMSIANVIKQDIHTNGTAKTVNPDPKAAIIIAQKIKQIADEAKKVFIERDEVINVISYALSAGEHCIMLAKPGTSKSKLIHYFADAMQLNYFWITLNPDTVKEDLMGPISMKGLDQDIWTRKWAGIATAHIALTDEIGKASNQVINLLIPVLEERRLTTPSETHSVPVHSVFAATNETLGEDSKAVWDRYTYRVVLQPISDPKNISKLIRADVSMPPSVPIHEGELKLLRVTCDAMSIQISPHVEKKVIEIWSEIRKLQMTDSYISDRRWKRWMRCAAGHALLNGRESISVEDLIVGKWMLWDHLQEREKIQKWLEERINESLIKLRDAQALLNDLRVRMNSLDTTRMEDVGKFTFDVKHLLKDITTHGDMRTSEWKKLKSEAEELQNFLFQLP